jgi:hypothetical protein
VNPLYFYIGAGFCIGGWIGWWIGSKFNEAWAFLFGCAGAMAGALIGWGLSQKYI